MKCLYQVFKLTVVVLNLVSLGMGYAKFYQLFSDIGSTIKDIGNTESFEDLAWLPYLVVQVSSTVGVIIAVFCLVRELCQDHYMFNHCFKPCFIITVLIYCLAVVPKSVLNIVYRSTDVSLDDWWAKLTDVLDSLLGGLAVLGFQIVLFMKVIIRVLRSAGTCKGSKVGPEKHVDYDPNDNHRNGCCCIVLCCSSSKTDKHGDESSPKSPSKAKVLYNKGSRAVNKVRTKVKSVQDKVDNKKQAVKTRITQEVDTRKQELKTATVKTGKDLRNRVSKNKPSVCDDCVEYALIDLENGESDMVLESKQTDTASEGNTCRECGKEINEDAKDSELDNNEKSKCQTCCDATGCSKVKSCCCSLLNDRLKCFIITMILTHIHFFIYIAELVLVLCVVC